MARCAHGLASPARLQGQAFASDPAPVRKDSAAVVGGHAGPETKFALARQGMRLEGSFHDRVPFRLWGCRQHAKAVPGRPERRFRSAPPGMKIVRVF